MAIPQCHQTFKEIIQFIPATMILQLFGKPLSACPNCCHILRIHIIKRWRKPLQSSTNKATTTPYLF